MNKTEIIKRRYNRLSRFYNIMERGMSSGSNRWRNKLFSKIKGPKVLEVGVGTGANLPHYPRNLEITGIDFSPGMLQHARQVAEQLDFPVELLEMDVQSLAFADGTFDTVLTSCVFCSVPDPIMGLKEIHRVLRPNGQLIMLEHVLSCRFGMRQIMNLMNPLVVTLMGANINRETKFNLQEAGFSVEEEDLWFDILKMFVARPTGEA